MLNKNYNRNNTADYSLLDYKETTGFSRPFLDQIRARDQKLAEKLEDCGETLWLNDAKYDYVTDKSCNDRFCPKCAEKRSRKFKILIKKYLKEMKDNEISKYLRFITLTYENVFSLDEFDYSKIGKDCNKFIKKLNSFGYKVFSGYRSTECPFHSQGGPIYNKKTNEIIGYYDKDSFHVHVHMLYFADVIPTQKVMQNYNKFRAKYNLKERYREAFFPPGLRDKLKESYGFISKRVLSKIWQDSNHRNSYIVDVKMIKYGMKGGVGYLCKYISKGFEGTNNADVFVQMHKFLHGKKLIQKFGLGFKDFKMSNFRTFVFGYSGVLIRPGRIGYFTYSLSEVIKDLHIVTLYLEGYDRELSLEENYMKYTPVDAQLKHLEMAGVEV